MASTKLMKTKDGRKFYRIRCSRGHGVSPYETRWYVPEGLSAKSIQRGLDKAIRDFENKIDAGEVQTRTQKKQHDAEEKAKEENISTLRQYAEKVYMPRFAISHSENSRANYQGQLNRYIYPKLGDMKLPDIKPVQISAMLIS